jgi:DNA helicase IV
VLVQMEAAGEAPDDRVQDAVARSRAVKAYVNQWWPALAADRLVHRLLTDRAFLSLAADGLLDGAEQQALRWPRPPRSARSVAWSLADAVLVDEVADLLERTPSRGHVVLDEAQDLSPMMLRVVGRRSTTGSVTVLGDLAQATTPWATRSWPEALNHLGKPGTQVEELTRGFRVPGEVLDFAARLLPLIAPALRPPTSVRRSRGDLELVPVANAVTAAASAASVERVGSLGIIVPDNSVDALTSALTDRGVAHGTIGHGDPIERRDPVDVVPASLAKGLEFDHVVLADPEGIVASQPDRRTGLRLLYVCLTRAVTSLVVLHDTELPPELTEEPERTHCPEPAARQD